MDGEGHIVHSLYERMTENTVVEAYTWDYKETSVHGSLVTHLSQENQ